MGAEDPHSVPMIRIEEPERVFDREKVLGRDAASVFPTTAQENADKVLSATQAVVGSMSFVTESELAEIKAKRGGALRPEDGTMEPDKPLWQVLQELRDAGTTVLLSSHYLEEVDALADRLAILDGGKVIAEGTPDGLKQELGGDRVTLRVKEFATPQEALAAQGVLQRLEGVRQVVINRAQGHAINLVVEGEGPALLDRLRQQLDEAAVPVFSLAQSRPSLDDVYLQATGRTLMDAELASVSNRDPKAEKKQAMR